MCDISDIRAMSRRKSDPIKKSIKNIENKEEV